MDKSKAAAAEEEEEVDEEEDAQLKEEVEKNSMRNLMRLWRMNAPETPYLILGSIGALLVGGTQPGRSRKCQDTILRSLFSLVHAILLG